MGDDIIAVEDPLTRNRASISAESARSPRFEKIEVAGVAFVIQGLAVIEARGERRVDLPHYLRDGRRLPTFCLPEELVEPVGRLVLDAYRESAGRVA